EGMRMIQAAADAGAGRRHDDNRHVVVAVAGPALVAGDLEQVDGVEAVVAELDFGNRPAAGIGDAHGGTDDAAFIERRVPRGAQPLRGGEDAAQRRADILAEDVGDAEVLLTVVQCHANSLNESGHATSLPSDRGGWLSPAVRILMHSSAQGSIAPRRPS